MNAREKRYWIGVASKEHVKTGVAGGFSQLCHGKAQPLKRMAVGDGLIYYSAKEKFGADTPCQQFTAIGVVVGSEVYPFEMFPGFVPYRRDIRFFDASDAPIRPLIERLSFIRDKRHWGYAFRYGHLEISRTDFELIATEMLNEKTADTTLSAAGA
ncbi:MAG TPA: EVE domain-containing protein [Gallionella sp.]|nr:EVE domain-containing protein [Gallionella sp.]